MSFKKLSRSPAETDKDISQEIISKLKSVFPIKGNFYLIEAKDFAIKKGKSGIGSIKNALINGSTVNNTIVASMTLKDANTGKVIDRKRRSIMTVPAFTDKGSFVIEGSSYVIPLQQRLRPGVYTMKKRNGGIETMFNLSRGRNFSLKIKGDSFQMKVGSAHVALYSILKSIGVSDEEMKGSWGEELFLANSEKYNISDAKKFMKLFSYGTKGSSESKNIFDEVKDAIESSIVDENAVSATLGMKQSNLDGKMLLKASVRLLKVYNNIEPQDDRENMMFKQIVTPDKMLGEAFDKNSREAISKIRFKLSYSDTSSVDDVFSDSHVFSKSIRQFVVTSKASIMPEEYNPLMMHMANHQISPMGEGGVGDSRALNLDTKAVHQSHLGFIDPIVSPEGASVGVTLAITENAYVDNNGVPAAKVMNAKTGKREVVSLEKLWKSKVAYPISEGRIKSDGIFARVGDKDVKVKSFSDVDYYMESANDMHAPSMKMIPMANSADGNRGNMGQKHSQQAQSLKNREAPNVSVAEDGKDYNEIVAKRSAHIPVSPVKGTVTSIRGGVITVQSDSGEKHQVEYVENMPLARKTFVHHTLSVKVGDKVSKDQHLADSNFTKDGKMALGKNLDIAWHSMKGNRNDGVVLSESAAKEMESEHMYKENISISSSEILDLKKFMTLYPKEVSKWGAENYDSNGVIKQGVKIKYNQPMAFILKKADSQKMNSKFEKVTVSPMKAKIVSWHHHDDGDVTSAIKKGSEVRIAVKTLSPMKVGDKMSGRYGNKGVVTRIVPDEEMPYNPKTGKRVQGTMTSAGVISRTNGASLIEAGLSKVSDKTGKKYKLDPYAEEDNNEFLEREAKKHGVDLYEELIDPKTGKPFDQKIFVGKPFMMKLFKDSESGMSGVGVGSTDVNEQPNKGGSESASSYSNMELNALLAYGAKSLLSEAKHIKGQKNDEYFDAFRRGMPLPKPAENFATKKFNAYLSQLGTEVRHDRTTGEFSLLPMTDKEVVKQSNGKLSSAETIYAKNSKPVKGGLFDDGIFGGHNGTKYAHMDLGTTILNPMYKDHVSRILGITNDELMKEISDKGIDSVKSKISKIDTKKEIKRLKDEIIKSKNPQVANRNIKSIKVLEKSSDINKHIKEIAFISKIPVIPPAYRPASVDSNGEITVSDLNMHYQDIYALSDAIVNSRQITKETKKALEKDMYKAVGALYGVEESPSKKMRDKGVKGILDILGGSIPKDSFNQKYLLRNKQFMSGRAVIVPARKDIGLDEVEIPEDMGLKMYEPHISRRMSRAGYSPADVKNMIEKKDPKVMNLLNDLGKEIPVAYNRAPTLWKHGILGAHPIFVKGSVMGVNPLTETAFNSDYDGDQMAVHVPLTQKGISDIKNKMMFSQNMFNDRFNHENPDVLPMPDQDATLGFYKASVMKSGRGPIKVKSVRELEAKIKTGDIRYIDYVKVG